MCDGPVSTEPTGDTTIATAADINAKVDAAVTAIESGDYATAIVKLMAAKALMAGKPDQKNRTNELTYDRAAIDSLIRDVRVQQNASQAATLGIQKTNIKYVATTETP